MLKRILQLEKLCVRRGVTILDGVDWEVHRGEHWVILGSNGSGKTSLLSSLTGYLVPSDGRVEVLGKVFGESNWQELRKSIGLVSSAIRQRIADGESALDVVVSGKDAMINHWGRISKKDRERALELLQRVEATELAERNWVYLSQGERQRVLIARAMMGDPALLILDEPCAGLDPVARVRFLTFLDRLGKIKGGPNLVLVTHHVEEIGEIFTHVLVLKNGRVLAQGKKQTVVRGEILSEAFGAEVKVRKRAGQYHLDIIAGLGGKNRNLVV